MKAVVYTDYGTPDVLHTAEIEKPAVKENEILVRVRATSVNFGDLMARNFKAVTPSRFNMIGMLWLAARVMMGWNRPRAQVLGSEFSGVVAEVGAKVTKFKPSDAVFGYVGSTFGAYAEFLCLPENGTVALKPEQLTFEEAAAIPYGAIMAYNLLKLVEIQPGDQVLINGASGAIGSAAVQLARLRGAVVTGVCGTGRMEAVRALGAERVVDYTREDFTQSGQRYDLIFDILRKGSPAKFKKALMPKGALLYASFKQRELVEMMRTRRSSGQRVICKLVPENQETLDAVRDLIAAGKLKVRVDRRFTLEQAAEAHRYAESGQKKGPVVLTLPQAAPEGAG